MKDKFRLILKIFLILVIFIVAILFLNNKDDIILYGPYEVVNIVDGDTIWVNIDNNHVKVRLLCINTPESVHSDESKNTEEGKLASNLLKEVISDSKVYLEYDEEILDQYGRTLAYVYLDDQETMANREMIRLGYAKSVHYGKNIKYYDEFKLLEDEARRNNVGLWETGFYE